MDIKIIKRITEIVLSADCRVTAYENLENFFEEQRLIEMSQVESFIDKLKIESFLSKEKNSERDGGVLYWAGSESAYLHAIKLCKRQFKID